MREIVIIAHNLRSSHNVGSLLRTAEGLSVSRVYLSGYTPYPLAKNDDRLPHIARKVDAQIQKTALGAEKLVKWQHEPDIDKTIHTLQTQGYVIIGLEQTADAVSLPDFRVSPKIAVIIGREVEGIEQAVLDMCDKHVQIPMFGKKESFNVVQASAIFLGYCRFGGSNVE